jgi:hypothetical protein
MLPTNPVVGQVFQSADSGDFSNRLIRAAGWKACQTHKSGKTALDGGGGFVYAERTNIAGGKASLVPGNGKVVTVRDFGSIERNDHCRYCKLPASLFRFAVRRAACANERAGKLHRRRCE